MAMWHKFPCIYEVHTRVWLGELALKMGEPITLANVPETEFLRWKELKVDFLWLMGVWEESVAARACALGHQGLWAEYRRALPDVEECDVGASPFAIASYTVSQALGGESALLKFRRKLEQYGIGLLLDFVPNHVARDCKWLNMHAEYFIAVPEHIARQRPDEVVSYEGQYFACGKDPYFPAWTDTLQLNYANTALHAAMKDVLKRVAKLCDGVRCDMAMLILQDIFNRSWGEMGVEMKEEFWKRAIEEVKSEFPHFLFIAEAYWDTEWTLQQHGFDFVYDKRLYDRIRSQDIEGLKAHLQADVRYQQKLIRFTENHDEARALTAFGANHRVAALLTHTAIGAHLLHEGEHEGRRIKLPVQLRRRTAEEPDQDIVDFYHRLSHLWNNAAVKNGDFRLLEGYSSHHIIGFERKSGGHTGHILVFVNLTSEPCESYYPSLALSHVADYEHIEVFVTDKRKSPQFELCQGGFLVRLRPNEGLAFIVR